MQCRNLGLCVVCNTGQMHTAQKLSVEIKSTKSKNLTALGAVSSVLELARLIWSKVYFTLLEGAGPSTSFSFEIT